MLVFQLVVIDEPQRTLAQRVQHGARPLESREKGVLSEGMCNEERKEPNGKTRRPYRYDIDKRNEGQEGY